MTRKLLTVLLCVSCALAAVLVFRKTENPTREEETSMMEEGEEEKSPQERAIYHWLRSAYEFDMVKDPRTGKIPFNIYELEMAEARSVPNRTADPLSGSARVATLNNYIAAGPNNIGGRTRALAYDIRYNGTTNRVIMAGSVSGGIQRSTDGGATWNLVSLNEIHSLTSLAQDPRPGSQDTWYAGGGEAIGNSASAGTTNATVANYLGQYIWKSVDNGATWTKLPNNTVRDLSGNLLGAGTLEGFDHPFDVVHKIAVNPVNGDLYICGQRRLVRSQDGGATFQVVMGGATPANAFNGQMDLAINNAGKLLLGVNGGFPDANLRGVWVSNTGNINSFTRIAGGSNLGVDSVANWRGNTSQASGKRIVLNFAPSNGNIAYILYENGLSNTGADPKPEADLWHLDMTAGYTWSNRSANLPDLPNFNHSAFDPFSTQQGYDMHIHVKPTDPNFVILGGVNLYRSTDGFATPNNYLTIGGYKFTNTGQFQFHSVCHPDMHNFAFNPSNPNEAITANDGGLQRTADINANNGTNEPVTWQMLPNYRTLQYYYVAIDPEIGKNNFLGGSQDNGTHIRDQNGVYGQLTEDSNNHYRAITGDGASVSFGNLSGNSQLVFGGFQLGGIRRIALNGTSNPTQASIMPNGLTENPLYGSGAYGEFVTNFKAHPDNTSDLYYVNFNRLFRTTQSGSVSPGTWTELTMVGTIIDPNGSTGGYNSIRAMSFTRGPYNTSHAMYLGTTNGRVFRIDDPRNVQSTYEPVEISPPFGVTGPIIVQDIAVNPNDDNEILVIASNYGVVSVWWTNNAKSADPNWRNAEGNLLTPSFRSCMIVVKKDAANNPVTEYYVGTSVGLFSVADLGTTLLAGQQPVWQREGGNVLNYAVIQSMAYRPGDNVLLIGTHGNGLFYTHIGSPNYTPNVGTGITPVTNDRNFIRLVAPTLVTGRVAYTTGNMIGIKKLKIRLMDLSGRTLTYRETGYSGGDLELNRYPAGTYILSIYSDDGRYRHIQKLVKQ